MRKEVSIVLVKSKTVAPIVIPTKGSGKGSVFHREYYGRADIDMGDEYWDIAFTSEEPIKKGDTIIQATSGGWVFAEANFGTEGTPFDCTKVISSTAELEGIPKISDQYAKKYACYHEKPEKVFVEYNVKYKFDKELSKSGIPHTATGFEFRGVKLTEAGEVIVCEEQKKEMPLNYSGIHLHVGALDEDHKARLLEELKEGMKSMGPITINSGYRDINWVPPVEENWDDIFKIINNPDISAGTKEAMIREKYHSPSLKRKSLHAQGEAADSSKPKTEK